MRLARRGSGTAVAEVAEVIFPLLAATRERLAGRNRFRQLTRIGRQIEQHPMHPRLLARCIWVIADERKALRIAGSTAPAQWGRNVLAISCVHLGNRGPFQKGSTRQVQTGSSLNVLASLAA